MDPVCFLPTTRPCHLSISSVVRRASRFEDLLAIPGGDGPYVFTRMFRETDRKERRRSRRHFKLLKHVDGTLREIVEPNEKVVFLTRAWGLSFWEQWVLGWRRAVVLTDCRAILLQLQAGRRPGLVHEQLAYGAITTVGGGPRHAVEVGTRGGDILELRGLRRADRQVLAERLRSAAKGNRGAQAASHVEHLCPHCHKGLLGRPRSCPSCLRDFRKGWLSALSSLLIPGLGDFRVGYRAFAVLELLTAVAIWAAYLVGPGVWGMPGLHVLGPEWVFTAVHGADAVLTWRVVRGGLFLSGMA
jgi:hypothetical protein